MESITYQHNEKEPEIVIDTAKADDAVAIARVQKEGWVATYPNEEYGITKEDILSQDFDSDERIQKRIRRIEAEGAEAQTWVARQKDQVIGYSSAAKDVQVNRIVSVYLLPEYQGKGIGRRLFQQALDWLGNEKDIVLGVVPYNDVAINFYKRFDFQMGESVVHDKPTFETGKDLPEVEMILPHTN